MPDLPAPKGRRTLEITVEVFPPTRPEGLDGLAAAVDRLFALDPTFVSVTYGAGGSTRDRSLAAVERLMRATGRKVAAHVTCVACTAAETDRVIESYLATGVKRFFALRGDVPGAGITPGSYPDGLSLVQALRSRGAEEIFVAAYPEVHPKAASPASDLDALIAKLDAGASCAVSQFFLDNTAFHRFRDALARLGLADRLVPGVLLFEDFSRAVDFAGRCGTRVPEQVRRRFDRWQNDAAGLREEARCFIAEQVDDLSRNGIDRFHLYTLNRSRLAVELFGQVCALRIPATAAA